MSVAELARLTERFARFRAKARSELEGLDAVCPPGELRDLLRGLREAEFNYADAALRALSARDSSNGAHSEVAQLESALPTAHSDLRAFLARPGPPRATYEAILGLPQPPNPDREARFEAGRGRFAELAGELKDALNRSALERASQRGAPPKVEVEANYKISTKRDANQKRSGIQRKLSIGGGEFMDFDQALLTQLPESVFHRPYRVTVEVRGLPSGVRKLEGHLFIDQMGQLALGQKSDVPTRYLYPVPLSLPISELGPIQCEVGFKFEPMSEVADASK
jgi:hypothetical protein